jgi:hypothetical protein
MGAAFAAETTSQDTNLLNQQSDQSTAVSNVESQIIVIDDDDEIEITAPTSECPGGVILVNRLAVLCLTAATGSPLGLSGN